MADFNDLQQVPAFKTTKAQNAASAVLYVSAKAAGATGGIAVAAGLFGATVTMAPVVIGGAIFAGGWALLSKAGAPFAKVETQNKFLNDQKQEALAEAREVTTLLNNL